MRCSFRKHFVIAVAGVIPLKQCPRLLHKHSCGHRRDPLIVTTTIHSAWYLSGPKVLEFRSTSCQLRQFVCQMQMQTHPIDSNITVGIYGSVNAYRTACSLLLLPSARSLPVWSRVGDTCTITSVARVAAVQPRLSDSTVVLLSRLSGPPRVWKESNKRAYF